MRLPGVRLPDARVRLPPSMNASPLVTVVVPTRARPHLVGRAVMSALGQTETRLEVIVVLDGPDPATLEVLERFDDPRIRVVTLEASEGAQVARNFGIASATAPWVALLDDDDEWLPGKLAAQLRLATSSTYPLPVVSCRLIGRTKRGSLVRPRRLPRRGEPLSDYLAIRHQVVHGEGLLLTSTLLAPTELFRRVPFEPAVRRFQDFDWVLRAAAVPGVGVEGVEEPLCVWHEDDHRPRISHASNWQETYEWARANRALFTPRAYAAVMMGLVSSMAAGTHDLRVARCLLGEATRHGRPTPVELATFLQIWLLPAGLRRAIRDSASRHLRMGRLRAGDMDGAVESALPAEHDRAGAIGE